jgi:hypothetical protein
MPGENETYIGDGVYAKHEGYHLRLRTERENGDHHVIYLGPTEVMALCRLIREQGNEAWLAP